MSYTEIAVSKENESWATATRVGDCFGSYSSMCLDMSKTTRSSGFFGASMATGKILFGSSGKSIAAYEAWSQVDGSIVSI